MKSKSGITLIALVITVIVLLILAGVSISLVVGNNGVLTQASNAVIENRKAEAREDVEMAFASAEADYWSDWAKGSSTEEKRDYYQEKIPEYLDKTGEFINLNYDEQNKTYEVKYKKHNTEYTFTVDANLRVIFNGAVASAGDNGNTPGGDNQGGGSGNTTPEPEPEPATYTVSYDSNGGTTGTMDPQEFTVGNSLKLTKNSFEKEGYSFLGWNTDKDATNAIYEDEQDVTDLSQDITLYAIWEIDSYSITYSGLDGASLTTENPTGYTVDTNSFTLNNPQKNGYTFAGWTGTGLSSATKTVTVAKGSTGNRTYTATWTSDPIAGFGTANPDYTSSFGKKVSGYSPSSGSNWRLFYADSRYAYLISDSVGTEQVGGGNFSASGDMLSDDYRLGRNLNPKYTETGNWALKTDGSNINVNIKGVSKLLNTTKWMSYKTSDTEWVIGAPTLEMFIASYNETHTTQLDSRVSSNTATGYQVKFGTGNFANSVTGLGNSSNLDKAIYCPSSFGWWLASPSDKSYRSMCIVSGGDSGKLCGDIYSASWGVRPLACVPLSKIGNGNGQISITSSY